MPGDRRREEAGEQRPLALRLDRFGHEFAALVHAEPEQSGQRRQQGGLQHQVVEVQDQRMTDPGQEIGPTVGAGDGPVGQDRLWRLGEGYPDASHPDRRRRDARRHGQGARQRQYRKEQDDDEEQQVLLAHREELRVVRDGPGQPTEHQGVHDQQIDDQEYETPQHGPFRASRDQITQETADQSRGDKLRAVLEIGVFQEAQGVFIEGRPQQQEGDGAADGGQLHAPPRLIGERFRERRPFRGASRAAIGHSLPR